MSSKAVTNFVSTILQHFPPFRWEEAQERTWMDTMIRELSGFSDEVLAKALAEMVRTRKDRRIPLVSECINACVETRRTLEAEAGRSKLPMGLADGSGKDRDWTEERLRLADDLIMSPVGRQATKEGWIGMLHAYCRKNARLPPDGEIGALKRAAKEFDQIYAELVRGPDVTTAKGMQLLAPTLVLQKLGAAMLKRREEKIDRVKHAVVK